VEGIGRLGDDGPEPPRRGGPPVQGRKRPYLLSLAMPASDRAIGTWCDMFSRLLTVLTWCLSFGVSVARLAHAVNCGESLLAVAHVMGVIQVVIAPLRRANRQPKKKNCCEGNEVAKVRGGPDAFAPASFDYTVRFTFSNYIRSWGSESTTFCYSLLLPLVGVGS
jgi:hypothetical protein